MSKCEICGGDMYQILGDLERCRDCDAKIPPAKTSPKPEPEPEPPPRCPKKTEYKCPRCNGPIYESTAMGFNPERYIICLHCTACGFSREASTGRNGIPTGNPYKELIR